MGKKRKGGKILSFALALVMTLGGAVALPARTVKADTETWVHYSDAGMIIDSAVYYGGENGGAWTIAYSGNNTYYQYTFTGTGVEAVTPSGYFTGYCDVYIDGALYMAGVSNSAPVAGNRHGGYFIITGLANGEHTIKLVSVPGGNGYNSLQGLWIYCDDVVYDPAESVSVTGAGGVDYINVKDGTLQMSAAVSPSTALQGVTWSVANGTGSASISATGLLTAVSDGTVTVRATAEDGSGVYGEQVVTISGQGGTDPVVSWFTVNWDDPNIIPGNMPALPAWTPYHSGPGLSYTSDNPPWGGTPDVFDERAALTYEFTGTGVEVYFHGSPQFVDWSGDGSRYSVVNVGIKNADTGAVVVPATAHNLVNNYGATVEELVFSKTDLPFGNYKIFVTTAHDFYWMVFSHFLINGVAGEGGSVAVSNIAVSSAGGASEVGVGKTLAMSATVTPVNASVKAVDWSVVNGTGSATISSAGVLTGVSPGNVTVVAAAKDSSGVTGQMAINVVGIASDDPFVHTGDRSMKVSFNASQGWTGFAFLYIDGLETDTDYTASIWAAGDTNFILKVADGDNQWADFASAGAFTATGTWQKFSIPFNSGDNTSIFFCLVPDGMTGTVYFDDVTLVKDGGGSVAVTNPGFEESGTEAVGWTFNYNGCSYEIYDKNNIPVSGVEVTSAGDAITTNGGVMQLLATVSPPNAANKKVVWSITGGTGSALLSPSGTLTAVADGTITVTATAQDGSGLFGSKTITVSGQTGANNGLDENIRNGGRSLKMQYYNGDSYNLQVWQSVAVTPNTDYTFSVWGKGTGVFQLRVVPGYGSIWPWPIVGNYYNASGDWQWYHLTFNSGDNDYVTFGFNPDNSNATVYFDDVTMVANSGVPANVANPGFESSSGWNFESRGAYYAPPKKVTGITVFSVNGSYAITERNGGMWFDVTVLPSDASDKSVTWSVESLGGQATISNIGYLQASPNGNGTVRVKATARDGSGMVGYKDVEISNQETNFAQSISVHGYNNADTITVKRGTLQMIADILPENTTNKSVNWSVDNIRVASISASGVLTAITDGTVTVTGRTADGTNLRATCVITISGQIEPESGITYYISNTGDDFNDGMDPSRAFKTIERANEVIFRPGDSLLFERGGFWFGELRLQGEGSPDHQCTLGAYTGDKGEAKPIINGSGYEQAILMYGVEYWTVEGLEIVNDDTLPYIYDVPPPKRDPADPDHDPGVRSGNCALRMFNAGSSWARCVQVVDNVKPNTDYTFSAWVRTLEGWENLGMAGQTAYWTYLQGNGYMGGALEFFSIGNNWQYVSMTFNSGNNTSIKVDFIDDRGTKNSVFYIDDVSLTEASRPYANLLTNPGFEDPINTWGNWDTGGSPYFARITRGVEDTGLINLLPPPPQPLTPEEEAAILANIFPGANSSLQVNRNNQGASAYSAFTEVEYEVEYEYTAWVKGTGGLQLWAATLPTAGTGIEWTEPGFFPYDPGFSDYAAGGQFMDDSNPLTYGDWTPLTAKIVFEKNRANPLNVAKDGVKALVNLAIKGIGSFETLYVGKVELKRVSDGEVVYENNSFRDWNTEATFCSINEIPSLVSPNIHSTGKDSLRSTAGGSGAPISSPWIDVVPGASYTLKFWAKGSGGVRVNDSALISILGGEIWEQKTLPMTFTSSRIQLTITDASGGAGYFIDDLVLTKDSDGSIAYTVDSYDDWWRSFAGPWYVNYEKEYSRAAEIERTRRGINVVAIEGKIHHNIILRDLDIHDVYGMSIRNMKWWSAGILVTVTGASERRGRFDGMLMEDIYFHDYSCNGVYINCGEDRNTNMMLRNLVVRNCVDALEIGHGDRLVMEYCAAYDVAYYPGNRASAIGGPSQWASRGGVIQYCEYGRIRPLGDSMAIDVEYCSGVQLFQYNYIHDVQGSIIATGDWYDAIIFRYNIIQNVKNNGGPHANISCATPNNYFYNNIFYSMGTGLHDGIRFSTARFWDVVESEYVDGFAPNTYFENNIFYCETPIDFPDNIHYSNNLYYFPGADNLDPALHVNGIFGTDPMLIDPGKGGNAIKPYVDDRGVIMQFNKDFNRLAEECAGYMLQEDSPCAGTGLVITTEMICDKIPTILNGGEPAWRNMEILTYNDGLDFFGNVLPDDMRSIGAFEAYGEPPLPVYVTGVEVEPTEVSLVVGGTAMLKATVTPSNATDKAVTWASSDDAVATVNSNGVVTAKGVGTATITVTTVDCDHTATCAVTVRGEPGEVDMDALIALLAEAEDVDFGKYDKDSVETLIEAMEAAKLVIAAGGPTQDDVYGAYDALEAALEGLTLAKFNCAVKSMLAKVGKQQAIPIEWDGYVELIITSSNPAVCRVDGRTLMPLKVGAAVITIEAPNGARVVFAVTVSM